MPTQLHAIGASVPGFKGLQLQSASSYLTPDWATVADNLIFDDAGRLAARKGYTTIGNTVDAEIEQIYEYISVAGVGTRIFSTANGIYKESSGTVTDISSSLTIDDGNWKFQNWNDGTNQLVLGLNNSNSTNKYIQWNGSGDFTSITPTSGTVPTGSDMMVAWGRVFGLHSNDTVLAWSQVIDHDAWGVTGAGTLNLYNVFGEGMDRGVAIAPFNNQLIIFGRNNILIYGATDATRGSAATDFLDPNDMVLVDTIHGTGCVARDSVQNVGSDIVFLSPSGLQSLGRLVQERSAPLGNESGNVRDHFIADIKSQSDKTRIRSCYSETEGFYLVSFPDLPTPEVYCFDMKFRLEDGSRRVTIWNQIKPTAMFVSRLDDRILYMSQLTGTGPSAWNLTYYTSTTDNATNIPVHYESGWVVLNQGEQYIIPKNISGTFVITGSQAITFRWAFDFQDKYKTYTKQLTSTGTASVYGTATWNVSTYTSGTSIRWTKAQMGGYGETIKYGFTLTPAGAFAANKLELHSKLGRIN